MEHIRCKVLCVLFFVTLAYQGSFAQVANLHKFVTETARFYDNQLVTDGTHLYGVRYDGHTDGKGAIFRTGMNGEDFELLHVFDEPTQGYNPVGALAFSGTTLYGMTAFGGSYDVGIIFKIETDGTGFQKLLDFNNDNGAIPYTSLIISGSILYGTAGPHAVFRLNTDGSGFQKLLSFNGSNGANPVGALAISGDTLFGVTNRGGTSDLGVIYRVLTNGEEHEVIFNFDESTGYNPFGGLTVSGTTLYGTTGQGGSGPASGSPFSINTNGTGFESFTGLIASNPNGKLTLIDSIVYGMTTVGGYGSGVIYALDLRDKTYTTLHQFDIIDGQNPSGSLLLSDGKFYGYVPGGLHGYGVMFGIDPDGENFTVLKDFEATNSGFNPRGGLVFTTGRAYGVTSFGGTHNGGVVYSINHDGTDYRVVHNFERAQGWQPGASLVLSDSVLYGVTLLGGSEYNGVLFRVDTTGRNYEVLHHFTYAHGSFPSGSLVDGGEEFLFGVTSAGGIDNKGTVFQFNKETKKVETLIDFATVSAQNPRGTMVLADTILYGLALGGVGDGILFSVKTDGTNFTKIVDMDSESAGRYGNSLALKDSVLFVSMTQGGTTDMGVLFSVETDGSNFKKLFDFSYASGAIPEGAIHVTDSLIYGMTQIGGPDNNGTTYQINRDGTGYTPLFTFDDAASTSGRISSGGAAANTFGSISVFDDVLYATVTSKTERTTTGSIRRYELYTSGNVGDDEDDEDGEDDEDDEDGEDDDTITSVTPDDEITVTAFPNPAVDYISIHGPTGKTLTLLDASGRRLTIEMYGDRSVNMTRLPPGIYYLVVGGKTLRIVKY